MYFVYKTELHDGLIEAMLFKRAFFLLKCCNASLEISWFLHLRKTFLFLSSFVYVNVLFFL